jgi:hypothetical protein
MMLTTRQSQAATGGACSICLPILFIISLQHHSVIMSSSCIRAIPARLSTMLNLSESATFVSLLRLLLLLILISVRWLLTLWARCKDGVGVPQAAG